MKVDIKEWDGVFALDITPETIAEAALLVRIGMNATKELVFVDASAHNDGTFTAAISIRKAKRSVSSVGKGRW